MNAQRDELAEVTVIGPECFTNGTVICYKGENYTRQPRTITTAEELDALGFQAVILDGCNTPYICERYATDRTRAEWQASGTSHLVESEDVLEFGPATVLYEPEASK